jgi:hypothetical protein
MLGWSRKARSWWSPQGGSRPAYGRPEAGSLQLAEASVNVIPGWSCGQSVGGVTSDALIHRSVGPTVTISSIAWPDQ